jgi:hypothetical protein
MAALLTLFSVLLFSSPQVRAEARRFDEAGAPDVARTYKLAAPEYRTAIPAAYLGVDPEGEHPEWELELWRICRREAWCGHFGPVTVHEIDGWAGAGVYVGALEDGLLDPEGCEAHRLEDYAPAVKAVKRLVRKERWSKARGERMLERLAELPLGEQQAKEFSTRGGFGQMQGRHLHLLGSCVEPDATDDPDNAAFIAATTIAGCKRWDGEPGRRFQRHCTCVERTRKWVGGGRWVGRSLWRNARSVKSQCGIDQAAVFWLEGAWDELGALPLVFPELGAWLLLGALQAASSVV